MSDSVVFTAYVAGPDEAAVVDARLHELCRPVGVVPQVRVVDVKAEPAAAEAANIIGTPTVVLEAPPPRRRLIGQLDDDRRAASALGLDRFDGGIRRA
jgi:circadian clock protein KaiB